MIKIPKDPSEAAILEAATETAKLIAKLDRENPQWGDTGRMAADIVRCCRHHDGYEMARDLEVKAGWRCDMSTARVLHGHGRRVGEAYERELRAFQAEHGVGPTFAAGDRVATPFGGGAIDEVSPHWPMTYMVRCDDGQVRAFYFDEVWQ